ncbi:MAG TPA: aldo/keto reductase, partial [Chloroflexi bacterium]|nr:aldo/keto reductase [Chloroflexota bacterium]
DTYGGGKSEEYLGKALKGRRDDVLIATKFGNSMGDSPYMAGGSRRYVHRAVEASLRRLGTEYIDLYQMHIPDPQTPIEETLSALDDLTRAGKIRYVGSSNFSGWQIADADWVAQSRGYERFISAQNHYNLLNRDAEREVVPACERFDIGILPFFPLASGMLTGKYHRNEEPPEGTRLAGSPRARERYFSDAGWDKVQKLTDFAEQRDLSLLQIAIGWLAAQPQISSVIAGATKPEQVEANVRAAEWVPSEEDLAEIDRITA